MRRGLSSERVRAWLTHAREALRAKAVKGPFGAALFEFVAFGVKQAWACIFGGAILALLLLTHFFYPPEAALARYDFLTIACVAIQALLLASKLETWEEAQVILAFHVVGTVMEVFKTQMGSWTYPEPGVLKIADVPLFSGFMYAAVGSYLARVWRILEFKFDRFPPHWAAALLGAAIYANFFTHHFLPDIHLGLFLASLAIFGPTVVWFRPDRAHRPMPLALGFLLVATFIWFAENIATFSRAWIYPHQAGAWTPVSVAKLGSWYLLMIISFVLVATIDRNRAGGGA